MPAPIGNFGSVVHGLKQPSTVEASADASPDAQIESVKKPFGQTVSSAAHEKNEARKAGESSETQALDLEAPADVQADAAIIEQSFGETSVAAGNPQELTVSSVVAKINEILSAEYPEMGDTPIQKGIEQGIDVSPEATADRIVKMTTSMFHAFSTSNPNLDTEALVNKFVDVISGGISQGFDEAREILDGMGVLGGDIASNIDATFDLVMKGLEEFKNTILNPVPDEEPVESDLADDDAGESNQTDVPTSINTSA